MGGKEASILAKALQKKKKEKQKQAAVAAAAISGVTVGRSDAAIWLKTPQG